MCRRSPRVSRILYKSGLFPPFFKRVYSFFLIFLNWIADFALWTIVFRLFYRYSVLIECICGFSFLWCKNVSIELFYSVINILYVFKVCV
jgi:hypothetical protein